MRLLWTAVKVVVALAIAIPLGIFALAVTAGVASMVVRLVFVGIRLAIFGLIGYTAYRIFRRLRGSRRTPVVHPIASLPSADPYYVAAMRELDAEIRTHP